MNPFDYISYNTPSGNISEEQANEFLSEIEELCRKHNISISHEDTHGAFILERFDEDLLEWLKYAQY